MGLRTLFHPTAKENIKNVADEFHKDTAFPVTPRANLGRCLGCRGIGGAGKINGKMTLESMDLNSRKLRLRMREQRKMGETPLLSILTLPKRIGIFGLNWEDSVAANPTAISKTVGWDRFQLALWTSPTDTVWYSRCLRWGCWKPGEMTRKSCPNLPYFRNASCTKAPIWSCSAIKKIITYTILGNMHANIIYKKNRTNHRNCIDMHLNNHMDTYVHVL